MRRLFTLNALLVFGLLLASAIAQSVLFIPEESKVEYDIIPDSYPIGKYITKMAHMYCEHIQKYSIPYQWDRIGFMVLCASVVSFWIVLFIGIARGKISASSTSFCMLEMVALCLVAIPILILCFVMKLPFLTWASIMTWVGYLLLNGIIFVFSLLR